MPDINIPKLQAFVESALSNPLHPLYKVGFTHSPILQHYAVNVKIMPAIKAEQWFKDYPEWTAKLNEAMAETERQAAEDAAKAKDAVAPEIGALRADLAATNAKLAEALTAIAALTPAIENTEAEK